jgi:limonene-1,2-epoxide hydrolase
MLWLLKTTVSTLLLEIDMNERRHLLKSSGGVMLATFLASTASTVSGQENSIQEHLTEEERANIRLVDKFCAAWEAMDLQQVTATMTDQCVYRQSQDTPPVNGHQALIDLMQPWIESSHAITYEVLETFSRGPVVINRRIDIYHSATNHLEWEGVGLFLIEDGLIREWQDFTMRVQRG